MSGARNSSTESVNQATQLSVFMSVGRASTPQQEAFVSAIEEYLRDHDLTPRALGRTEFSSEQPLKFVAKVMRQCSGTVIIAFERRHIVKAVEMRGSENPITLENTSLPTVWNQIEAAQAYTLGQPLLVIVERNLHSEGLLEDGYDWYVQWVDIDASTLYSREFSGVFTDWKKRVEAFYQARHATRDKVAIEPGANTQQDIGQLSIGQLISRLRPAQLWATIIAVATAVSALAVAAYKLGTLFAGGP